MRKIVLKKEDVETGDLVLINQKHTLKSKINNLVFLMKNTKI